MAAPAPRWQPWSPQTFERARSEDRLVFLYLEAVWCHWCHVMQDSTLQDPEVLKQLEQHYIAVRVDHDADPALANRYRDYGWPALIILDGRGRELVKRSGYIEPRAFARLLSAVIADPTPEAEAPVTATTSAGSALLTTQARKRLLGLHDSSYDNRLGGLLLAQKFIDRDSVEYALVRAAEGDQAEAHKARQTLDAARALIDPVWGGAYQYSTHGDWAHPHYEKIMRTQAGVLRSYALAYALWHEPRDLAAANAIRDYLFKFLRAPDGAFYVSQDADLTPGEKAHDYFALDDARRRKRGLPRVDRNRYAQANGQAIEALALLYQASGDPATLAAARKAAQWVLKNRSLPGGGFRHGKLDAGGPYLGDNLAMAAGCLELYRASAEREWLACASASADFIIARFSAAPAGFSTGVSDGTPLAPQPDLEENIVAARFFNQLRRYTGEPRYQNAAEQALRYLTAPAIVESRFEETGILLAADELGADPPHLTIVGGKQDPVAQALYAEALRTPGRYKRVEWWDRVEGVLPNNDVSFPQLAKAAVYVCSQNRCSRPSFTAVDYHAQIGKLLQGAGATMAPLSQ